MGPGGGTVFYVSTGFTETGTPCNTSCRYLEAAPVSGTNAWTDFSSAWSSITNVSAPLAQKSGIGFGYQNTQAMYTQSSSAGYPAASSIGYRGPNNFSDWFIPSSLEAMEMFKQKNVLAFISSDVQARYWSSTETSGANGASKADSMYTISGGPTSINKNTPIDPNVSVSNRVPVYSRAVRAF
jgi:hypothetical protein